MLLLVCACISSLIRNGAIVDIGQLRLIEVGAVKLLAIPKKLGCSVGLVGPNRKSKKIGSNVFESTELVRRMRALYCFFSGFLGRGSIFLNVGTHNMPVVAIACSIAGFEFVNWQTLHFSEVCIRPVDLIWFFLGPSGLGNNVDFLVHAIEYPVKNITLFSRFPICLSFFGEG